MPRGRLTLTRVATLGVLLTSAAAGARCAPLVEELGNGVRVMTPHLVAEMTAANGGLVARVTDRAGTEVCLGQGIYTDWGIYAQRQYVGTAHSGAAPVVKEAGERVVVTATGELRTENGGDPGAPGRMDYSVRYTFSDGPEVSVEWMVTPSFDLAPDAAFFSFIMHTNDCRGVIARTEAGVLLQDMATTSGRSYQSALEPLDATRPLLGLLRSDGAVLLFTGMVGRPDLGNVFVHESGQGAAGVFLAWETGGPAGRLVKDEPWRGGFTMRLTPTVEDALAL